MAGSERHIKDVAKTHDHKAEDKRRTVDRKLDEALEESFPGSYPVSISQPKPSRDDKDPLDQAGGQRSGKCVSSGRAAHGPA